MDSISFDRTTQTIQQHTFNSTKILDKHEILLNRKVWMNILLCRMISMFVVNHAFKINVLKMEQEFWIKYHKGDKVLYVFPINWKGMEEFC
jgi:hypothetical protein